MSKDDDIKEISTGCVLVREEKEGRKILLIERFDRGTYEIPKGHVEDYDKTLKMAAERELREETGLTNKIKIQEVIGIDGYEVTKKRNSKNRVKDKDGRCWKAVVYFRATLSSGSSVKFDTKICEEGTTDLKWFNVEELKKIRLRVPNTLPWMIKALKYDEKIDEKKLIESFKSNKTLGTIFNRASGLRVKDTSFSISMFDRNLILEVLSHHNGLEALLCAGFKHVNDQFVLTDRDSFDHFHRLYSSVDDTVDNN